MSNVKILKTKKEVPTVIEYEGRTYALVIPNQNAKGKRPNANSKTSNSTKA